MGPTMRHTPQSRWQEKVFEDVLKERFYQDRQWGQNVDDKLNTPWMWCEIHIVGPEKTPKNSTTGWLRQVPSRHLPLRVSFARETRRARPSTNASEAYRFVSAPEMPW